LKCEAEERRFPNPDFRQEIVCYRCGARSEREMDVAGLAAFLVFVEIET
jgi:hypothetical protein